VSATPQPAPGRNAFAAVFASRRQVDGLDDDAAWRLFLKRVTGKDSLRQMTSAEVTAVVSKLKQAGARSLPPKSGKGADVRPQAAKLRRLWEALWELGVLRERSDSALASFVMAQTGIEALRWNNPKDLNLAIEALKSWCKRIGYWPKPAENLPARMPMYGRYEPDLIASQWNRLMALGALKHPGATVDGWLVNQFGAGCTRLELNEAQAREAIRRLGQWLRKVSRGLPDEEGHPGD
jgi:hypothetical protein